MHSDEAFAGNDRFRLQRLLGTGAFGIVYEAFDRERDALVALKVLRASTGDAVYRFKHEFRSLADLVHPNLVSLYELISDGRCWFFTMELVRGRSFTAHFSADEPHPPSCEAHVDTTAETSPVRELGKTSGRPASGEVPPLDWFALQRLRDLLEQLTEGLDALHEAGKLHRDVKPSNVLVTPAGRLVLLDFGLVADVPAGEAFRGSRIVGTPAYMSPEQAAGDTLTPASDWYSVGIMLYEVLNGDRPIKESVGDGFSSRRAAALAESPPLPPWVPADLASLVKELLQPNPGNRPSARRVLEYLGTRTPRLRMAGPAAAGRAFVGRQSQLADLHEAYRVSISGSPVAMLVSGASGIGKTALVQRFLDELSRDRSGPLVLAGRCYEQEAVPYKAFDSLVDALTQHMKRLPRGEIESVLPVDVHALARLFPVLRRVAAVRDARRRVLDIPEPRELRRRAFAAMRELLVRLCARQPVVLVIDDLQWGDLDSAALIGELVRPPDGPPLLLVACYRSVVRTADTLVRQHLPWVASSLYVREVNVPELSPDDALRLARELMGSGADLAEDVARESGGNPFLLDELARAPDRGAASIRPGSVSLRDLVHARVRRLPESARRLLDVISVAGEPVPRHLARVAAGVQDGDPGALSALRAAHLVRLAANGEHGDLETWHDRIREAVVQDLATEQLAACHLSLALAYEATPGSDPESLARHFELGGRAERAAEFFCAAAEQAAQLLAFDRAARLYQRAHELGTPQTRSSDLLVKLGDALANAGRGRDAARAYQAAAATAPPSEAVELQRRAADQLLRSGHLDEGLAELRSVLRKVGLALPASPRRAFASILLLRARIAVRGLGFRERAESTIPRDELVRLDTCWSGASTLGTVDVIRGQAFQARHLLMALQAGEPARVACALAYEAGVVATVSPRSKTRNAMLLARARAIAERLGEPRPLGMVEMFDGISAELQGRFAAARVLCGRADEVLRERCTGVHWEVSTNQLFLLRALAHLGALREHNSRIPALLLDAEQRGDVYFLTFLGARALWLRSLSVGDPAAGRDHVRHAMARWSAYGFHQQHFWALISESECDLYEGDTERACRRVEDSWPSYTRSLIPRVQLLHVEALCLRGRAALAHAASLDDPETPAAQASLARAARTARRIGREPMPPAPPLAALIRAGMASVRGNRTEALDRLAEAEAGFLSADMALHAAATRRQRAVVERAPEAAAVADRVFAAEGIVDPARFAALMAPGDWERIARGYRLLQGRVDVGVGAA